MAMRNYRAMNPDKLERCVRELQMRQGDAYSRVVDRGEDLVAHMNAALSAARAKGVDTGGWGTVSADEMAVDEPATERPAAPLPPAAPLFIRPMLAFDVNGDLDAVPRDGSWAMEPKWDGHRYQFHRLPDGIRAVGGRNGKDHSGEVPEVEADLMRLLAPNTVLDGEIVWENSLVGSRAQKQVMFVAFDVLQADGENKMRLPWSERRGTLEGLLGVADANGIALTHKASEYVFTSMLAGVEDDVFDAWIELGMEGAVCKRRACPYIPGARRQDGWIKVKPQATTEATVVGFVMGRGQSNRDRCGALEIRLHDTAAETTVKWDATPAEAAALEGRIVEVQHYGFQPSGKVRHPCSPKLRPDLEEVAS